MKKFWNILLVVGMLLFLVGCATQPAAFTQKLIGLPDDAKTLIAAFVTAAVAWALLKFGAWIGIDTTQYVQPLAAAIAPILVMVLEWAVAFIPSQFDDITLAVLHWLVLLISGSVGAFLFVKRVKQPKQLLG